MEAFYDHSAPQRRTRHGAARPHGDPHPGTARHVSRQPRGGDGGSGGDAGSDGGGSGPSAGTERTAAKKRMLVLSETSSSSGEEMDRGEGGAGNGRGCSKTPAGGTDGVPGDLLGPLVQAELRGRGDGGNGSSSPSKQELPPGSGLRQAGAPTPGEDCPVAIAPLAAADATPSTIAATGLTTASGGLEGLESVPVPRGGGSAAPDAATCGPTSTGWAYSRVGAEGGCAGAAAPAIIPTTPLREGVPAE